MSNRDTYKYHLKVGNKIVYAGITKNPKRREIAHQNDGQHANTHLVKIGNVTTREAAREWESGECAKGISTGH